MATRRNKIYLVGIELKDLERTYRDMTRRGWSSTFGWIKKEEKNRGERTVTEEPSAVERDTIRDSRDEKKGV